MESAIKTFTLCEEWTDNKGKHYDNPRPVYDYDKKGNWTYKGRLQTGVGIFVNSSKYSCVDIDIETNHEEVIELFMNVFNDMNVRIEKTASRGLHIWCLWDNSLPSMRVGRATEFFGIKTDFTTPLTEDELKQVKGGAKLKDGKTLDDVKKEIGVLYLVDLFTPINPKAANYAVVAPSKAKGHDGIIRQYKTIKECDDENLVNLNVVVKLLEDENLVNFNPMRPGGKFSNEDKKEVKNEVKNEIKNEVENEVKNEVVGNERENENDNIEQILENNSSSSNECTKELFELLQEGILTLPCAEIRDDGINVDTAFTATTSMIMHGLYGCVGKEENSEVSVDDVSDFIDEIRDQLKLHEKAKLNYLQRKIQYRNQQKQGKIVGCGVLINMFKKFHPDFYNNELLEYYKRNSNKSDENITPTEAFEKTNYTLNDYLREAGAYKTRNEHELSLRKCVAIHPGNGYFVKQKLGNSFRYREVAKRDLESQLNIHYTMQKFDQKEEINPETGEKISKKETKFYQLTPKEIITSGNYISKQLAHYTHTTLMSDEEGVLSKYIPPQGVKNDALAERFIKFFENRVYNPEALHDLLSAHSYRLRHPNVKIVKFYVSYSPRELGGNTGKTFLSSVFDMLYPDLSVIGVRDNEAKSEFNSFLYDYLNVNFEELENEKSRNQFFETFIKRSTNRKGVKRTMYHEAESGEISALFSLNTNSKDLYGLINASYEVINRLVILNFKPALSTKEWDDFKTSVGLNDKASDYKQTRAQFAAAFYNYLRFSYEIPHTFTPDRYYGEDRDAIISELRANNERLPMRFIKKFEIINKETGSDNAEDWSNLLTCSPDKIKILRRMRDKNEGVVVFVSTKDIVNNWDYFVQNINSNDRGKYTVQSVIDELKRIGFVNKHTKTGNGLAISETKYNSWCESMCDVNVDDDDLLEELDD